MCECVFQAARGYLLISHARAFCLATPQRSIYRPSSRNYSYCPMLFLELVFFFPLHKRPLYLGIIASKKLLFIIDLASHRMASFHSVSMRIELPHCAGHCLSIIMLSVICFHARLKHFQFRSRRSRDAPVLASKGAFQTTEIMIQLNFNQKSMNCQLHAHSLTNTHIYTQAHIIRVIVFVAHMAQFVP